MRFCLPEKIITVLAAGLFALLAAAPVQAYEDVLVTEEIEGQLEKARLNEIFEKYLATIELYDPERATMLGVHEYDQNLTERTQDRINSELDAIANFRQELKQINKDNLPATYRIDLEALDRLMEVDIYDLEHKHLASDHPQYYLEPVYLIYFMLTNDYQNIAIRGANALSRLKKMPSILQQAERTLSRPPKTWTEQAIKQAEYMLKHVSGLVGAFNEYVRRDPRLRTDMNAAIDKFKIALERYIEFLKDDILPIADGDMAAGSSRYGFYLERHHSLNMTPRKAHAIAEDAYYEALREIKLEARGIDVVRTGRRGWKSVLANLPKPYPEQADVLQTFQDTMSRALMHFDESKVISYPRQRILIKELPLFMTAAYNTTFYQPPFSLDDNRISQIFAFMPQKEWSKDEKKAYLENNYSYSDIEILTSFLIVPGMHVHDAGSSKHISRIRRISKQPIVSNGWAAYSEYLAEEQGFFKEPYSRFMRCYKNLKRTAEALVDTSLHTKRWTAEEASKFLQNELDYTKEKADETVIKISLNPTEAFSYIYGMKRILKMRNYYVRTEAKFFDLRKFHDMFLSLGEVPIDLIEEEVRLMKKEDRRIIR